MSVGLELSYTQQLPEGQIGANIAQKSKSQIINLYTGRKS